MSVKGKLNQSIKEVLENKDALFTLETRTKTTCINFNMQTFQKTFVRAYSSCRGQGCEMRIKGKINVAQQRNFLF